MPCVDDAPHARGARGHREMDSGIGLGPSECMHGWGGVGGGCMPDDRRAYFNDRFKFGHGGLSIRATLRHKWCTNCSEAEFLT